MQKLICIFTMLLGFCEYNCDNSVVFKPPLHKFVCVL